MMAFLRKSLSQDSVDRYCDTWAFLFLSVLAISFLFIPLAPSVSLTSSSQPLESEHLGSPNGHKIMKVTYPKYKSHCWTPVHFPDNLHSYAETVCSSKLNSLAQGKGSPVAGLYEPLRADHVGPAPGVLTTEDFRSTWQSPSMTSKGDQIKTESHRDEKDKFLSGTKRLIQYKTPLLLLVLAICLRLPHAIWALFSTCCGCMNVDKTLSYAQQMYSMDAAGKRKIREELSVTLRRSKKTSSLLYMIMKLLMFAVVLTGFKVNHDLVMEIDQLENDLSRLELLTNGDNNISPIMTSQDEDTNSSTETRQASNPPFDGRVLLCDFSARVFSNLHRYTVQCLFTVDQRSGTVGGKTSPQNKGIMQTQMNEPDYETILLMYKCLLTIVLSLLIVLTILTITSLVMWLVKLVLPSCRPCLGLKGDEALDVVFIVAMAWLNTSPTVAMELAKCTAVSDKQQSEGEVLELS